jgi:hypothetical protein
VGQLALDSNRAVRQFLQRSCVDSKVSVAKHEFILGELKWEVPISDVLNVSISVSGAGPTRAGFGEPILVAYHTKYTDRVREYSDLTGLVADGFAVTDPVYLMASAVKSQNPAPPNFKVGRRALAYTQVTTLTCLSTSNLDTYKFSLRTPGGTWHDFAVASTGTPATDVATINTAVTAAAIPNLTATHGSATLTLTMAVGFLLDVKPGSATLLTFADTTTDPGIATDLAAIAAADNAWYGILLDSQSKAEIAAAAVYTEANKKLFVWNNSDSADMDPSSTTDIFYTEKQLAHARDAGLFAQFQLLCYSAAAWMGRLFPTDAGSENWAFKTLAGVPADNLTDNQIHAIENKNGSVYTPLFGLNLTQFGKQPGGEWIDVSRGVDALTNELQVQVLNLQANTLKIPFTDAGIDMYRSTISGVLKVFTDSGFIAAVPPPFVSLPKAAAVDPVNKAARNLPNVSFTATLAGAINSAQLNGVLTQ